MGFLNFFKRRSINSYSLTDEDRQKAADLNSERFRLRREKMQLEHDIEVMRLKVQQAKLKDQLSDFEDDSPDEDNAALMTLISSAFGRGNVPSSPVNGTPQIQQAIHLTDEDIDNLFNSVPKVALKAARGMSDAAIHGFIIQKVGQIDEDTFNRVITKLRK